MDLTDAIGDHGNDVGYLHDCIYAPATRARDIDPYQVISYCFTEVSTKWSTQNISADRIFSFAQLDEQHISSEQLHLWSAPIDVIERYQLYLNQRLSACDVIGLEQQFYYNCTLPRFGPLCQYSLDIYQPDYPSLDAMISDFYRQNYDPIDLTCYVHLTCNYGTKSACLDWSDVCDGYVDCQGGIDEAPCWQLNLNRCEENERRCENGQCIPVVFWRDDLATYECLDGSDVANFRLLAGPHLYDNLRQEPTVTSEDLMCVRSYSATTKLTSSCVSKRSNILELLLFFDRPSSVTDTCWLAMTCSLFIHGGLDPRCSVLCSNKTCEQLISETCLEMWNVPAGTVAFGHMFFLYTRDSFNQITFDPTAPQYVCYDDQLCDGLDPNKPVISFQNATCREPNDFPLSFFSGAWARGDWYKMYVAPLYTQLYKCNTVNSTVTSYCDPFSMYQCMNSSKCIPKRRICDLIDDCDYHDDEDCIPVNNSCAKFGLTSLFHCTACNLCLSSELVDDNVCHCDIEEYDFCEDEDFDIQTIRKNISFPTICDGYTELLPVLINNRNETDETECEYWSCNNTYTRCNGFWNCFDGADEVDCRVPGLSINCSQHHHICVSPSTIDLMCLPLEKANDGIPDCLGGTDEPKLCRATDYQYSASNFYCIYPADEYCVPRIDFCYGKTCDDETEYQICAVNYTVEARTRLCDADYDTVRSEVESFFCARQFDRNKAQRIHFTLDYRTNSAHQNRAQGTAAIVVHSSIKEDLNRSYQQTCHRGLVVNLWLNTTNNSAMVICMCPPSYYGNRCQYQNQRVSLTMRIEALPTYRRTAFVLSMTLLDDSYQRQIHSYRQVNYLFFRDCRRKFNVHLLYATRPKDPSRNYFVHIDVYEQISLKYRGSLLIRLKSPFLPVERTAVHLNIIRPSPIRESCLDRPCRQGQCIQYADNADELAFCHCNEGWSGKYCDLQHRCTCSSDSICVGVLANNRSICICPLNKWGPQCLLLNSVCRSDQNDICYGRGRCVPTDQSSDPSELFTCICQRGFSGKRCEIDDNQFILSFHKDIDLPQIILVHFIQIVDNSPPEIGTTFKTVITDQHKIAITWSHPWRIAFLDFLQQDYYLITVRNAYNGSARIIRTISPLDRCQHVRELLDKTIVHLHLLRRIKYYHFICRNSSSHLSCFYDEAHLCLCQSDGRQRLANCLEFNHTVKHNCFGQSYCENGAQCLQDRLTCPHMSVCVCAKCFYGIQCQFSSSVFDLSLDGILGYHIQPHASVAQQSALVKVSIGLTMIILIGGLLNGVLSAITFINKDSRKTGSGIYLLISSLNTLITMVVFALKFWILISAQISYITNRSFLHAQCLSLDFLVKVGVSLDQWLSACVSADRAIATIRGSKFNKKASKQMAKYVIIAVIVIIIGTMIQDPIYRHLLEENDDNVDEKRIWCIAKYTSILQRYNSVILMLHFITPVLVNILATVTIIINTARQRMTVQNTQSYQEILREQVRQLSHLLVAPLVFIALTIPRLIISFTSGCMKSGGVAWLFLIGYLISFVPLIFTFLVFVYPSKTYKHVFDKTIQRYRRRGLVLLNRNA